MNSIIQVVRIPFSITYNATWINHPQTNQIILLCYGCYLLESVKVGGKVCRIDHWQVSPPSIDQYESFVLLLLLAVT